MSHRNKQPSLFELTARDEFEPLRQCSCLGSRHLTLTTRHFSLRGKRVFSLSRGRGYPSAGGRVRGRRRKEIRSALPALPATTCSSAMANSSGLKDRLLEPLVVDWLP